MTVTELPRSRWCVNPVPQLETVVARSPVHRGAQPVCDVESSCHATLSARYQNSDDCCETVTALFPGLLAHCVIRTSRMQRGTSTGSSINSLRHVGLWGSCVCDTDLDWHWACFGCAHFAGLLRGRRCADRCCPLRGHLRFLAIKKGGVRLITKPFGLPVRPPTPPFIDDNTTKSRDAP